MIINFRVTHGDTKLGDCVHVVGSVPEIGCWNPDHSVPLKTDEKSFPLWSGSVDLGAFDYAEWKLITKNGSDVQWETLCSGNRVLAGLTGVTEATVHAFWGSMQSTVECVKRESAPNLVMTAAPVETPMATPHPPHHHTGPHPGRHVPHHHPRRSHGHGQRPHANTNGGSAAAYVKPSGQIGYYTLNGTPNSGPKKSRSCASLRRVPSFLDPIAEENGGVSREAVEYYDSDYDRYSDSDYDRRRDMMIHSPTSINLHSQTYSASCGLSGDFELDAMLARVPTMQHTQ
eukprot:tig00021168_g19080.t1